MNIAIQKIAKPHTIDLILTVIFTYEFSTVTSRVGRQTTDLSHRIQKGHSCTIRNSLWLDRLSNNSDFRSVCALEGTHDDGNIRVADVLSQRLF
ncbi:hypothetical protein BJI67_06850 [Acidihalobacter aeolianus]|uniref:Uncharacterized protein n=1 Tax=Acidihalobacter aeolianus TaxID=2792603 RepID=A0A1D8K772_9GAMM|nr:hypothetical protein BJI67_06850 [Acidihalobacter aeolianus]